MTSLDLTAARKHDWSGLPWPFMAAGLLQCALALLLTLTLETEPAVPRMLLLVSGLLCASIALTLRLNSNGPASLERILGPSHRLLLRAFAGLFLLLALAALGIFVTTFFDLPWFPWRTGTAVYICIVVVPLGLLTARRALQLAQLGRAITPAEESALLLLLAALCCFVACWALYLPNDPHSWNTMRLALAVCTGVALIGAPLALASSAVRRWTISVLVVLHFSAIATATLSAPPTPWVIGQIWVRLYRPYLEFMYLNNAYHFYAPEPGPPSHLWCRLIYQKVDDPEAKLVGEWFKVPRYDEKTGRQQHTVVLEYQRHLAMMSNIEATETVPFMNETTQKAAPFFQARRRAADPTIRVGEWAWPVVVPFHPLVAGAQQYAKPDAGTRRVLASFVRHVAAVNAHAVPGYELRWIKVYRARHDIVPPDMYAKLDPPLSPNSPMLYRPFYLGRYSPEGELLDTPQFDEHGTLVAGDPFLYWLLPIHSWDQSGVIRDYCRLHAGDPQYIRLPDTEQWVDEDEARRHFQNLEPPAPK